MTHACCFLASLLTTARLDINTYSYKYIYIYIYIYICIYTYVLRQFDDLCFIRIFQLAATVVSMVTIQFDIGASTVNESDGSVTINLVRMGILSDNITVCIGIIMIVDPAVDQCMYVHNM